jgi:hypothetical protein
MANRLRYLINANRIEEPMPDDADPAAAALPPEDFLSLFRDLINVLSDPATAKKRMAEYAGAANDARETIRQAQKAAADHAAVLIELGVARKEHDDKLAAELSAHTLQMQRRTRDVETREQNADKRERALEERDAKLKVDRQKLDKKLAAVSAAASD